jgi:LL-diaminopimelate aminotransferase
MKTEFADRVKRLPPYLFAEIEKIIKEKKAQGVDLISLSIGDPDLPPPPFVIASLREEVADLKESQLFLQSRRTRLSAGYRRMVQETV